VRWEREREGEGERERKDVIGDNPTSIFPEPPVKMMLKIKNFPALHYKI
jgi:hypothetical protein